jgi:hypothetical protein
VYVVISCCTTLAALTSHRNGPTFLFPSLLCLPVVGLMLAEGHMVALVGEPSTLTESMAIAWTSESRRVPVTVSDFVLVVASFPSLNDIMISTI